MKGEFLEDPWLGVIHSFPTVLHARGSLSFDVNPSSVQKALVSALSSLRERTLPRKITVADRDGYSNGTANFMVGIANGEAFDVLDAQEEQRVLNRIENRGAFDSLDLAVEIRYKIEPDRMHKVHHDIYLMRLAFEPGKLEALIHHLKGIRRMDPDELLSLIVGHLNAELTRKGFPPIRIQTVSST